MAYTYSKTDWTDQDHVGPADINRIFANAAAVTGQTLKTDWTASDFLTRSEWTALLAAINGAGGSVTGDTMTPETFNTIEAAIESLRGG